MPSRKKSKKVRIPIISTERIPDILQRGLLPEYEYMISALPALPVLSIPSKTYINNLDDDPIDLNYISNINYIAGSGLKVIRYLKNLKI